jgi:hypothetical protein
MSPPARRERTPRDPTSVLVTSPDTDASDPLPNTRNTADYRGEPESSYMLLTKSTPDTGRKPEKSIQHSYSDYSLYLVPEFATERTIYDILDSPVGYHHPIPGEAIDSLPTTARTRLVQKGHLRFRGFYNSSAQAFEQFSMGWDSSSTQDSDVFVQVLDHLDGAFAKAVYYYVLNYASGEYQDPELLAEIRGVQPETVEETARKAEESLPPHL